jgi:hypothetical protein
MSLCDPLDELSVEAVEEVLKPIKTEMKENAVHT